MATNNWARVYFKDDFAGILAEEPGGRCSFTYDESFIQNHSQGISVTLPLTQREHIYENGLHPFFDNLVAEGWLAEIQARALATNANNRFKLLMAFGRDLVGAVSVIDPDPQYKIHIDKNDYLREVTLRSKASMSGVQPKIFVRQEGEKFYPVKPDEVSTHIAKLPGKYPYILENEYLCSLAAKVLLAADSVVDLDLGRVEGVGEALLVKRFDRDNETKIHFEEFAQLLNKKANDKYDGSYLDLAKFINSSPLCSKIDLEKIFRRILVCILLGNTDAHLKNFAMYHTSYGLEPTPLYDMVCVTYYSDLSSYLALGLNDDLDLAVNQIKPKHLIALCEDFGLNINVLNLAVKDLGARLEKMYQVIDGAAKVNCSLKEVLKEQVRKRWNGIFKNIGKKK